jgi:coenzyme F420-reducing hydrogenase alpha subunit
LVSGDPFTFRAYDPCFGCATHANGPLPLIINIHGPDLYMLVL